MLTDAHGRAAFEHTYDFSNRKLRSASIDAGVRTTVLNAIGGLAEQRDGKGAVELREYDALNRLVRLWAADRAAAALTLRERVSYGDRGRLPQSAADDADRAAMRALNALGRPVEWWDEAGVLRFARYDFKGNLLQKTRQPISDSALAAIAPDQPWVTDWSAPNSANVLEAAAWQTDITLDGLNRPVEIRYPAAADGGRRVLRAAYNRAGLLEAVAVFDTLTASTGSSIVDLVAYNAKRQRVLIAYGNGVMTRYAYDAATFRLARLRTERIAAINRADEWRGTGAPLQDFAYSYDLAGNVAIIDERVPNCGIVNTADGRHRLTRTFTYDPFYRLTSANGRACQTDTEARRRGDLSGCGFYSGGPATPYPSNAPHLTEPYLEKFTYDPAGNMQSLSYVRRAAGGVAWKRVFAVGGVPASQWQAAPDNRLTALIVGQTNFAYAFDGSGNVTQQDGSRVYIWDHADRLIGYEIRAGAGVSLRARYLYGRDGMRVKKWIWRSGGGVESTTYVNSLLERARWRDHGQLRENDRLHVSDDHNRIASIRLGPATPSDAGPAVQYQLGDHLGSAALVVGGGDAAASQFVNREEYFPFGETSYGSFARKRYRFSGKERDEESGLNYHGARYYAPWTARWISVDPRPRGADLFRYGESNPMRFVDPNGQQTAESLTATGEDISLTALQRAAARWGSAEIIEGGAAELSLGAGAGAGGTELVAGASFGLTGLILAGLMVWSYKTSPEIQEMERREQVERQAYRLYHDGTLSFEEYLAARTSGRLPGVLNLGSGDVTGQSPAAKQGGMPDWLRQILQGHFYNKARLFDYRYHELYIINPAGGYYRLDAYNPGSEIVSRKFTQLWDVSPETAFAYLDELVKKYPVGAVIADVPSSGVQTGGLPTDKSLAGQKLSGRPILEVPYQVRPIPPAVIEKAESLGITIRDDFGNVYTNPNNNTCCCSEMSK